MCWKIVCCEINLTALRLKSAVVSSLWTAFSAACRNPSALHSVTPSHLYCTLHSVTLVLYSALRHTCIVLCTPSHLYCTLHSVTLVLHSALRHTCIALCTPSHLYCTLHSVTLVLHSALRHTCIAQTHVGLCHVYTMYGLLCGHSLTLTLLDLCRNW